MLAWLSVHIESTIESIASMLVQASRSYSAFQQVLNHARITTGSLDLTHIYVWVHLPALVLICCVKVRKLLNRQCFWQGVDTTLIPIRSCLHVGSCLIWFQDDSGFFFSFRFCSIQFFCTSHSNKRFIHLLGGQLMSGWWPLFLITPKASQIQRAQWRNCRYVLKSHPDSWDMYTGQSTMAAKKRSLPSAQPRCEGSQCDCAIPFSHFCYSSH